jgi:hypothetical protein
MLVIRRGALVVLCAASAMTLGAQGAQAEPKPEVPPPSHGSGSLQPSPTPSATTTPTTGGKATTSASTGVSTSIPAASRVVGTTATAHQGVAVSTASPRQSHAPRSKLAHAATPKPQRPPPRLDRLFDLRVLAGLRDLPAVGSSDGSGWLLAAGFALVLLVIAETSFLGLASSRFGARGSVRTPSQSWPADEPLPIRRVRLRR